MQAEKLVSGFCRDYGARIISMRCNKHPVFKIGIGGSSFTFVCAATASDWRSAKNAESNFRRLITKSKFDQH